LSKVCFVQIVFQSNFVLSECLRSIIPFGKVVVAEGPVKYWQDRGYATSTDGTNDVLHSLLPNENIVHGVWPEKDEMMNAIVHLIPEDTTHVFMCDSDEVWPRENLQRILGMMDDYDSMSFKPYSFFGGFSRYMTGFEENYEWHRVQRWTPGSKWATHRPPTILAPDGRPWREHRHLNHEATDRMSLRFAHYSYVFPRQILEKHEYYDSTLPGTMIPDYFKKVYLPWVLGDREKVEKEYRGVHNFLPERRGDCFTERFTGKHPYWIQSSMNDLVDKFYEQLHEVRQ
jgi:hypothetical protein